MEEKMEFVHSYIKTHKTFLFRQLLSESKSRTQVIVTFLVILELIKGGKYPLHRKTERMTYLLIHWR